MYILKTRIYCRSSWKCCQERNESKKHDESVVDSLNLSNQKTVIKVLRVNDQFFTIIVIPHSPSAGGGRYYTRPACYGVQAYTYRAAVLGHAVPRGGLGPFSSWVVSPTRDDVPWVVASLSPQTACVVMTKATTQGAPFWPVTTHCPSATRHNEATHALLHVHCVVYAV